MKFFIFLICFISFNLNAEVSRSPAVLAGSCDLDISTTMIKIGSEVSLVNSTNHQVNIRSSDEDPGCLALPKKRYADSVYEEHARDEIKILFQKYTTMYSKKCIAHFEKLGLKKSEFICDIPIIGSITVKDFSCDKKVEEGTHKISYIASANAQIKFVQTGKIIVEKTVEVVQKEQCARVNECIQQASQKEMPELKKLSAVACKAELTPVSTARAPAVEQDSSFDGNRKPKSETRKDQDQKNTEASDSVLK